MGTLEVSGTGNIEVAPDEATIRFSVITDAKTAAEAAATNAMQTQAVIDAVEQQPNHGVTTSGLSVRPLTTYDSMTRTSKITGFRATNGVSVKTKIAYAAQIFDVGIGAGANQSSGIKFGIQDEGPHRDEALRIAVKQAFAEASLVANAAQITLRGPESIQVNTGGRVVFRAEAMMAESVATPVLPDNLTISATVRIVFRTEVS
ncbi:SIMPL domain-containing protein [Enhygromyxa salina]|nr:SIMPL domain-containing protein [Enhygromyxa salina]